MKATIDTICLLWKYYQSLLIFSIISYHHEEEHCDKIQSPLTPEHPSPPPPPVSVHSSMKSTFLMITPTPVIRILHVVDSN